MAQFILYSVVFVLCVAIATALILRLTRKNRRKHRHSHHKHHSSQVKVFSTNDKITNSSGKIFFIADTHFDSKLNFKRRHHHFHSMSHMNKVMYAEWNSVVGKRDTVYFLGDFASHNFDYHWNQLNGRKRLIHGNHDYSKGKEHDIVQIDGVNLYLVHNPHNVPKGYHGWVIHGHYHKMPFFDAKRRRMCVSVDVNDVNYTPVSASRIIYSIKGGSK